jgi:hypothetical protein
VYEPIVSFRDENYSKQTAFIKSSSDSVEELEKLNKQYFKDCEDYTKHSIEFEKTMKQFYIG